MKDRVLDSLRGNTKKKYVKVLPRGNNAIYAALYAIKDKINFLQIPDQGGWLTYEKYAKELRIDVKKLKTDYGVLCDLKPIKKGALMLTSFAGYYAEQPMVKIRKACDKKDCILIEDASGSFGDKKLGKYGDIILGSFGKWKVVEAGTGGFIATNDKKIFDKINELDFEVKDSVYEKIYHAMKKNKLKRLLRLANKVKEDLKDYYIFHLNKRGINVITEYHKDIIHYCQEHRYQFVICPKDIKVNTKALSIELKRT